MVESFFRHKCDIYHHTDIGSSPGYGLPETDDKRRSYPDSPSLSAVQCLFSFGDAVKVISTNDAQSEYSGATELCIASGTAISQGDKVVDLRFNIAYTVGFPDDICGDYLSVPLYRTTAQKSI